MRKPKVIPISVGGLDLQLNNKLGVDNINRAFSEVVTIYIDVSSLIKKFSYQKALGLLFKLADFEAKKQIFELAIEEFKDKITTKEVDQIVDNVNKELGRVIDKHKVLEVVRTGTMLAPKWAKLIKEALQLGAETKDYVQEDLLPLFKKENAILLAA